MIPTEPPKNRAKEVTIDLLTDKSLPNIILGAFLTSVIQYVVGMVPAALTVFSGLLWVFTVLVYAIADRVKQRIEEEKNRLLDEESQYKGIE